MKLDFDTRGGRFAISGYADGWVKVGENRVVTPCVVTPTGVHVDLVPRDLDALDTASVGALVALAPDIVLVGTGTRQRFVDAALTRLLATQGIGLEIMDTGAACRSYNVLLAEDRAVIAVLYSR